MIYLFELVRQRLEKAADNMERSNRLKEHLPISREYWLEWMLYLAFNCLVHRQQPITANMVYLFELVRQRLEKAADNMERSDRLKEHLPISREYWLEWMLYLAFNLLVLAVSYTVALLPTILIRKTPLSAGSMIMILIYLSAGSMLMVLVLLSTNTLSKSTRLTPPAEREAHLPELNRPEIELNEQHQQLHGQATPALLAASASRLASRDTLQALCRVRSSQARDDQDCVICLDAIHSRADRAQVTQLPCNHTFHNHCTDRWLDNSFSCPQCTREMVWVPAFRRDSEEAEALATSEG